MNLIFIGPPGAGKGTQSEMICNQYKIQQLSTGDILRGNIAAGTDLGKLTNEYMKKGKLVPDEVIINMIKDELAKEDYANGFILDGFPRTIPQAEALDYLLQDMDMKLDSVLLLEVPDSAIIERLSGRRTCRACNKTYHIVFNPPPDPKNCEKKGQCDLYQRDDDKEETIRKRLDVYHTQTSPLVNYYSIKKLLTKIDGLGELKDVFGRIQNVLNNL